MSSAPELKELEFALKIRRALDERAGSLGLARGPAPRPVSLARRIARALPLAVLLAGIAGIAYWENLQHTAELADIDAAMLSDDLPLNAYLDHGFNAYLTHTR